MAEKKMRVKVLVVDDEESVGVGMSEILKDEGFEAAYVISGFDAVEAVKKEDYRVVFMDMLMPGMNGLDTPSGRLKKYGPAQRS